MGTRNSPALFSEFMAKSLTLLTDSYPDKIRIYQDDVAVSCSSLEETTTIATLVKDQMKLAGLVCNDEKTYWDHLSTKPLLGAIWAPLRITQKPEAIQTLQKLHGKWLATRTL
eukprot:GHVP01068712.1.p1 GENE.GHVP01068712.1~~GHVP01068712.1.p1  ORF type:complete len:113 (-),score=15.66 GHVP01068712.1:106-444(-)